MDGNALEAYMGEAIDQLIRDVLRSTLENPRETAFLLKYAAAGKQAHRKRVRSEEQGVHIPSFLIASIAASCNLYCKGCYARANRLCGDTAGEPLVSEERWREIFVEAEELGVSFILLAGGEPMLRKGVILQAAKREKIIFPIFTNGTVLDEEYLVLFDKRRNLVPVLSLEGGRKQTDARRGEGTYARIEETVRRLHERKILFGASITVTTENLREVTQSEFIEDLYRNGFRIVFFVEYVPAENGSEGLAPGNAERAYLEERLAILRERYGGMLFISFPGDEKLTGGCVAAGRGFFHINPYGGAEPCPFSPYSDRNVKTGSLLDALQSPLFYKLKERGYVGGEHMGGCSLFMHEQEIQELCGKCK